jgi:diguanylate cyclase (GGDEF)-like protein
MTNEGDVMEGRRGDAAETARRRARQALPGAAALIALAGVGDWATGPELSFSAFYLPGVALAAAYGGRRRGVLAAVLAGAVWLAADHLRGPAYSHAFAPYWNASVRLAVFATVAVLVAEVRRYVERERARADADAEAQAVAEGTSFYQQVETEYARLLRYGRPLTLAYLDFGPVQTDDCGGRGAAGCAELLAELLRDNLRGSDVVARPRGREFAVLLPEAGPDAAATALARLRDRLDALRAPDGSPLPPLAVGAVTCVEAPDDLNRAIQRAYQLMYDAHRAGEHVALRHETCTGDAAATSPQMATAAG